MVWRGDVRGDGALRADALRARLFEQGVVLVTGCLDDDLAARSAAELMTLDALCDDAVQLLLNTSGSSYSAAFTLIDVIDLLGVAVHATCIGRAEGPSLGVLAVAARRSALLHARLRFAEPDVSYEGYADDVAAQVARHAEDRERFSARLAEACGRPARWFADAMAEGRLLDVHEALRMGVIDEVATSRRVPVLVESHRSGRSDRPV